MSKKLIIGVIGIATIGIVFFGIQMWEFAEGVQQDAIMNQHSLANDKIIVLRNETSPNKESQFFEYHFDNGGLGYSRLFWSVIENSEMKLNLYKGLIPDGYKILNWNGENELIVEKWKPHYFDDKESIPKIGHKINGITIKVAEKTYNIKDAQ